MWFSLLLPVIWWFFCVLAVHRWWPVAIVLCVVVSAVSEFPVVHDVLPVPFVTTGLLQYLPVFCLGMIFALKHEQARALYARLGPTARVLAWVVALTLLVGTSMLEPFTESPPLIRGGNWVLSLLGAYGLVVLATVAPGAQKHLSSRPVMFFGTRSFSLYLVHEPIIIASALLLGAATWWPWVGVLPIVLLVIVAVTMVFYRWVERPSIAVSRAAGRFLSGPAASAKATRWSRALSSQSRSANRGAD